MPAKRRSVVISGAGDRRDEDIRQQTEIIGEFLAIDTALGTGHWALGTGHWALGTGHWALGTLQSGDLRLILFDQVEEALAHIAKRVAEG